MKNKILEEEVQKNRLGKSIKDDFEATLQERINRYMLVKPHGVIPFTPFAAASSECSRLFRDGHYYGCISLTQAVAEALTRFLCGVNSWKPDKAFEENVEKLFTRKKITYEQKKSLLKIWEKRDDYHHLNSNIESNLRKLETLAKEKLIFLVKLESEFFAFSIKNGKLIPKESKYWKQTKGRVEVFLRLD